MNEYEKEQEWKKKVNLKECNCCETCKYSTPIDDRESICEFEIEIHYVSDLSVCDNFYKDEEINERI